MGDSPEANDLKMSGCAGNNIFTLHSKTRRCGFKVEEKQISQTQLCALLWAGLMAPAAELLPAVTLPAAGRGAWLSALAAAPVFLLYGRMLAKVSRCSGGLAGAVRQALGPVLGRLALAAFLLWGELLLALRLRLCAQRLIASGERDGSLWFFLPAAALLTLWMARGKLAAFARAGQVFLAVLLTAAGAVLVLSLFQSRPEHLLPLWRGDVVPVLRSAVPLLGVLGYGVFAAFLLGDTEPAQRRDWLLWGGGGCLLLALEQAVVIGNLGPELAQRLSSPFFALAKSVGVEGAFQRVESIIAALWTFADFTLLGTLAFALWKIGAALFPKAGQKTAVTAALVPGAVLGIAAFPEGVQAAAFGREAALWGNLILGLAVPAAVFLAAWGRGMLRQDPYLVYKTAEKAEDIAAGENPEKKTEKSEKSD